MSYMEPGAQIVDGGAVPNAPVVDGLAGIADELVNPVFLPDEDGDDDDAELLP